MVPDEEDIDFTDHWNGGVPGLTLNVHEVDSGRIVYDQGVEEFGPAPFWNMMVQEYLGYECNVVDQRTTRTTHLDSPLMATHGCDAIAECDGHEQFLRREEGTFFSVAEKTCHPVALRERAIPLRRYVVGRCGLPSAVVGRCDVWNPE